MSYVDRSKQRHGNGLSELLVVGNLGRSLGAEIKGINIQAR